MWVCRRYSDQKMKFYIKSNKIIIPIGSIKDLGITKPTVLNCMENCLGTLLKTREHIDIISCVL